MFVSFGIQNEQMSVYSSLGMTIITLLNPIVTVYFVRSYRRGLLRILRLPAGLASTSAVGNSSKPQQPAQESNKDLSMNPSAAIQSDN